MQHIQTQVGDLERVRSQVAALGGERRGHVLIACSQALNPIFLRARSPATGASSRAPPSRCACDRAQAERDLSTFATDLAPVFEPVYLVDFEVLKAVEQPVSAVMSRDHPMAAGGVLRLRDCLARPHVVPSVEYGVRHLLELATRGRSIGLDPVLEADSFELMRQYVLHEDAIGFQIPIGVTPGLDPRLVVRPIDPRDIEPGLLLVGQLRPRASPCNSPPRWSSCSPRPGRSFPPGKRKRVYIFISDYCMSAHA